MNFINLAGTRFGHLEVLSFSFKRGRHHWWRCRCDCGNSVDRMGATLREGKAITCKMRGCPHYASLHKGKNKKHGLFGTKEYAVYRRIIQRCYKPSNQDYENYGARGIRVCESWLGEWGVARFVEDMGLRPSDEHSIERIDVNGPYSPTNCEWVTNDVQQNNKRTNRFFEFDGRRMTLAMWSREFNINPATVSRRLSSGWDVVTAFSKQPPRRERNQSV